MENFVPIKDQGKCRPIHSFFFKISGKRVTKDSFTHLSSWCAMLSHLVMCDSLWPLWIVAHGASVHGDSPGKNTGVGCQALLQGIFPTQGLNPGILHCRQILNCQSIQRVMLVVLGSQSWGQVLAPGSMCLPVCLWDWRGSVPAGVLTLAPVTLVSVRSSVPILSFSKSLKHHSDKGKA